MPLSTNKGAVEQKPYTPGSRGRTKKARKPFKDADQAHDQADDCRDAWGEDNEWGLTSMKRLIKRAKVVGVKLLLTDLQNPNQSDG